MPIVVEVPDRRGSAAEAPARPLIESRPGGPPGGGGADGVGKLDRERRPTVVRAVLSPSEIWVGYAPRRGDIEALLADPGGTETFVGWAGKSVRMVGGPSRGRPFEVLAGPVEPSGSAMREMFEDSLVRRMNLIRVFPMTLMTRPGADRKLEPALLGLVKLCRSIPALGAPKPPRSARLGTRWSSLGCGPHVLL